MTFISYNLLKNYIHESFVFPTKPSNKLHGGKGVFQKESASFVIGVSSLDWGYRVVNCDTDITVCCIVSYPTEASYHWAEKFSKISEPLCYEYSWMQEVWVRGTAWLRTNKKFRGRKQLGVRASTLDISSTL